ncbi:DUF58 domain-containing protein [Rhodopirellula europaea]|uniref:Protein containing DUF58 n=1 Tax=Rhodopirellula europaea SH398 TaxID=1263868 RepID=M5S7R3_9BACT|nr:DUF58 domain-containing protein [Rhodopirellula europaea]EMI27506.1 protein containing DUF58 [Rhodopirellula europaea SH398]
MTSTLSPETLQQIKRLDLRARMVVRGFLQGLHSSPLQGFSVQFSDHRLYNRGDDPKLIDWLVYAKTDKHYIKRFEAETNLNGFLLMDLSKSMGFRQGTSMTKFEYSTCLAAALTYLMSLQKDPVGLLTFDDKLRAILPARSRRGHLGDVLAALSGMTPESTTELPRCLVQVAAMLKQHSLVMLFSDLLGDPEETLAALARLRHGGHDVIVFHVLDDAEVRFPYDGPVEFEDPESGELVTVDATGFRAEYLDQIAAFRETYSQGCSALRIDYVPLDTSMPFDRALTEYLQQRQARF